MSAPSAQATVQAVCVRWFGRGLLLRGTPGSGKSDLALRLIEAGADLVADDLLHLERRGAQLVARPVALEGAIEARGQGLFRLPALPEQVLDLVIECLERPGPRLPEPQRAEFLGVALPQIALLARDPSAVARIRLVLFARPLGLGP